MIKTNESASDESASHRNNCWKENPECIALRVEPDEGGIFLLPYRHHAFSLLQSEEEGDQLAVVFATHAVMIKGRRLSVLLSALQKEAVEFVRSISERYVPLLDQDSAVILSTRVDTYVRENDV